MSRESKIRALAVALQPKSLDLTQFAKARLGNTVGYSPPQMRLRPEDAAGILAFGSLDKDIDGWRTRGDPLPGLLLELKYAGFRSEDRYRRAHALLAGLRTEEYGRAHALLLRRHGGIYRRRPTEMMGAVAMAALVEWVNDACPACRVRDPGVATPPRCPDCKPNKGHSGKGPLARREDTVVEVNGKKFERRLASHSPLIGCPTCHGLGRVIPKPVRDRGVRCLACHGKGRTEMELKDRWRAVSQLMSTAQAAVDAPVRGVILKSFSTTWHPKYYRFIEVLRATDRRLVESLDFGWFASQNSAIELSPPENQNIGEDEPAEERCPTADEPAALRGSAPPKET